MLLSIILYIIISISASLQDIKNREVSDIVHILIMLISLPYLSLDKILAFIIAFSVFTLPNFFKDDCIGGADIKFMACTGLLIGVEKIIIATIISMLIAIINTSIKVNLLNKKEKSIALIPYLAISCIFVYII